MGFRPSAGQCIFGVTARARTKLDSAQCGGRLPHVSHLPGGRDGLLPGRHASGWTKMKTYLLKLKLLLAFSVSFALPGNFSPARAQADEVQLEKQKDDGNTANGQEEPRPRKRKKARREVQNEDGELTWNGGREDVEIG